MLSNSALFAGADVDADDSVQQRRFAVVDVPEEGNNRRTRLEVFRSVFHFLGGCNELFFQGLGLTNLDVEIEFRRDEFRGVGVHGRVNCQRHAHLHEFGNNFCNRQFQFFRKGTNGNRERNDNLVLSRRSRILPCSDQMLGSVGGFLVFGLSPAFSSGRQSGLAHAAVFALLLTLVAVHHDQSSAAL